MHWDSLRRGTAIVFLLLWWPEAVEAANQCEGGNPGGPNHNGQTCYDTAPTPQLSAANCALFKQVGLCNNCDDSSGYGAMAGGYGGACCLTCGAHAHT